MTWTCPVCGYPRLENPPRDERDFPSHEICPSCGFEFGVSNDDRDFTYESWRERWVAVGYLWYSRSRRPIGWDGLVQLTEFLGS